MINEPKNKAFDLEERTAKFGIAVIKFCREVPENNITRPLVSQIVRSSTSIGANYCEANGASSKKDFRNKIHICQKESKETKHWLRMLTTAVPERKDDLRLLWQEAHELSLIFGKIISTLKT